MKKVLGFSLLAMASSAMATQHEVTTGAQHTDSVGGPSHYNASYRYFLKSLNNDASPIAIRDFTQATGFARARYTQDDLDAVDTRNFDFDGKYYLNDNWFVTSSLGYGTQDFDSIYKALREAGYSGTYDIESDSVNLSLAAGYRLGDTTEVSLGLSHYRIDSTSHYLHLDQSTERYDSHQDVRSISADIRHLYKFDGQYVDVYSSLSRQFASDANTTFVLGADWYFNKNFALGLVNTKVEGADHFQSIKASYFHDNGFFAKASVALVEMDDYATTNVELGYRF